MKKLASFLILLALSLSLVACGDPETPPENPGFNIALDLTDAWDTVSDTALVQGCVIVNTAFAEAHPNEMASFLSEYKNSINYIANPDNLDSAAEIVAAATILPSVAVAKQAIPRSNIAYLDGAEMMAAAKGFYAALNITSPADAFYYSPTGDATQADNTVIRIGYLAGTTGVGMAKMISDGNARYTFTKYGSPQEIMVAMRQGNLEVAALPTNAAPNLYDNGAHQLLAINTLGVLHVVTNGVTVTTLSDLEGKTIYVPEMAPKLVVEYILAQAGVEAEIVMEYDLDTLPAAIAQGVVQIAVLPEPKVTVANNLYKQAQASLEQ